VEAVGKIEQISRARCRREFEQRFTDRHMAEDYIRIYQQLLSRFLSYLEHSVFDQLRRAEVVKSSTNTNNRGNASTEQ